MAECLAPASPSSRAAGWPLTVFETTTPSSSTVTVSTPFSFTLRVCVCVCVCVVGGGGGELHYYSVIL